MLRLCVSMSLSWSIMSKNKSRTSRANMGTSVIYFCRLVLMAYFEPPFITDGTMLTTKKMVILKKEAEIVLWALAWLPPTNGGSDRSPTVVSSQA